MSPEFKITEEVVRQSVEVGFKQSDRWKIAFTNPTAGPWKMIKLGSYEGGHNLRYEKEEDRPDLILFNRQAKLFLVFEAKDLIKKLIDESQIEKSVAVFKKEGKRLDGILSTSQHATTILDTADPSYHIAAGYIYSNIECTNDQLKQYQRDLLELHSRYIPSPNHRFSPTLHLIVEKDDNRHLSIRSEYRGFSASKEQIIASSLPDGISR
jgi:hypothetical protein